MRFEVPQFIEIEDKIFGPFTWKQFVYLCGGVGVAVVTFLVTPLFFFILIGLPVAGLGFLLAFYPVNNRPFSIFLESIFTFYKSNRIYYWQKKEMNVYKNDNASQASPTIINKQKITNGGIQSLARKLELEALQKKE